MNVLNGYKTYIVAVAMICHAVIVLGWNGGDWQSAADTILVALGLSALRHGVGNGQ